MEEAMQEVLQEIVWDDHEDFVHIEGEMYDQYRWHTYYSKVVKQNSTGKFFELTYGEGSTEYQEWEGDITFTEVMPQEVTVTKYLPV